MMMGGDGNGEVVSVPPGFRFHPTDEELLYYYLLKKISYEAIDLDVIREVDLNKLEPWDLKEKCRIGTGDQNEWYLFSHKDKKYPTGSRTNRATTAGFWKATGRDKAIHHLNKGNGSWNSKRIIGMRKTLVFYTGRAPHGQKTDWIMHEYRLDDHDRHFNITSNNSSSTPLPEVQEDGWVVCRVFKKKNQNRISLGAQPEDECEDDDHLMNKKVLMASVEPKQAAGVLQGPHIINYQLVHNPSCNINTAAAGTGTSSMFDSNNMHLPQLLSSPPPSDHAALEHTTNCGCGYHNSDWSFLDKLLASHHQHQQHNINTLLAPEQHQTLLHSSSSHAPTPHDHLFSFHYIGHQN